MFPTYGVPSTGGYIPTPVQRFLTYHRNNIKAVVGTGNITFGPEFAIGAEYVAKKLGVPLLAKIDVVPTAEDIETINQYLNERTT